MTSLEITVLILLMALFWLTMAAPGIANVYALRKENHESELKYHVSDWKDGIPLSPTEEEFRRAWIQLFQYPPEECEILSIINDPESTNVGFHLRTPGGELLHGGFVEYTESPLLEDPKDLYYSGSGCTWGIDEQNRRYHLLDKKTLRPVSEEAVSQEILRRYIYQKSIKNERLY